MARGAAQQPGASAAVPRRQADLPLLAAALVMCAAWALTPLSDWVADLVVDTIPHSRDAELGAAAVAAARYTYASDDAGVAKLGRALVAQLPRAQRSQFNFTFAVIEEPYGSVENDHPEVLLTCQLQSVPQRWKDTQKV